MKEKIFRSGTEAFLTISYILGAGLTWAVIVGFIGLIIGVFLEIYFEWNYILITSVFAGTAFTISVGLNLIKVLNKIYYYE